MSSFILGVVKSDAFQMKRAEADVDRRLEGDCRKVGRLQGAVGTRPLKAHTGDDT